jgi:hypothetical protein
MPCVMIRAYALACLAMMLAFAAHAQTNVLFIFDGSGSMKQMAGAESRIAVAKKAMDTALRQMPPSTRLGLVMYGHRRARDCGDLELVSPIGADDAGTINRRIQAVDAKGETPIAEALRLAVRSFAALKGQSNSIVLVTDGIEECKGDPCAAAREIKAAGLDVKAHVVGFTLTDQQRRLVQCIPDITGGQYFEARDAPGLGRALAQVQQAAAPPVSTPLRQAPVSDNLLSAANGGRLVFAPSERWLALSDDKPAPQQLEYGDGVWSFKDGKPATFEAFEVLVPEVSPYNPKDIELLVGDEGPTGQFRSLGVLTVQNLRMAASPWQRFTFPPTTARYLKIAIKSGWGMVFIYGHEFKVVGKIDEAAPPMTLTPPPAGLDLVGPGTGGALVASSTEAWKSLTAGSNARVPTAPNSEGIWSFKDEKPANLSAITIRIPAKDIYNLKEFEVLVSSDSPTGPFVSAGRFTTHNGVFPASPYQTFRLPPTTARYVKLSLKTNWGNMVYTALYGVRIIGVLND